MMHAYSMEDDRLLVILREHYGIRFESLTFIPMGDSAYSYRVEDSAGTRYYLKLFDLHNDRQKLGAEQLPQYLPMTNELFTRGLFTHLTCPIPTASKELQVCSGSVTLVLFNYIEGETLANAYPFSTEVLEDVAGAMARLHKITPQLNPRSLQTETYDLSFERNLRHCMETLGQRSAADMVFIQDLRQQVLPRMQRIDDLLRLLHSIRANAQSSPTEYVLCHGDLWGGNIIRKGRTVYVLDWESAMLAPREMDLFTYMGDVFSVFFSAYEDQLGHSVSLNPGLLRFYAYRHHLRNLTHWLMNILYRNTTAIQSKHDLDLILHHNLDRWDSVEPRIKLIEQHFGRS